MSGGNNVRSNGHKKDLRQGLKAGNGALLTREFFNTWRELLSVCEKR